MTKKPSLIHHKEETIKGTKSKKRIVDCFHLVSMAASIYSIYELRYSMFLG